MRLSEATGTVQAAVHFGLKAQGSDDFNIAVVRGGRVVALLWMGEDIGGAGVEAPPDGSGSDGRDPFPRSSPSRMVER